MHTDLLEKIKSQVPLMSKGQKKIASYIVENCEKAAFLTATILGERAGVSESTVVRFAIELGYKGYPEFRRELQTSIKSKLTSMQRIEVAEGIYGDKDILATVLQSDIANIKSSMENISPEEFSKAVDAIISAKSIYIIGVRSSSSVASFLYHYLDLMFENVRFVQTTSGSELFERTFRICDKDLLIALSFPRYSKRTKKAVEFAKNNGAKILAITDTNISPIASLSDYVIYAKSNMISFADSLVAPLSVVNALIVALGMKKKETISETFVKLEEIWEDYGVYEHPET